MIICNYRTKKMGCCSHKRASSRGFITIKGYRLKRVSQIAEGGYGTIWQCVDTENNQTYALKEMDLE
jgi:serine/threonine protein kinase